MLSEFLELYADYRTVRTSTIENYRYIVARLERFLGREAKLADLCDETINAWLRSMEPTHAAETIRSTRCAILSVWNLAARLQKASRPGLVRQAPKARQAIKTLTRQQVRELLEAASMLEGTYNGYRRSDYYRTLIRA